MGILSALRKAQAKNQSQSQGQGSMPAAPRPTLIQGGPAFFTPEGYVPPVQPEQAFMPTDVMRDPIADMFAAQPQPIRIPGPPKMIDPPKPPDQIFIDDMPPLKEEPPMIVEEPPVMDQPTITMDDIDRIRRERGGPGILDRNMIDYGYGPGIMPPTPDIFLDDMETRGYQLFDQQIDQLKDNPFKDRVSDMVPLPDTVPVRKPFVQELRPPLLPPPLEDFGFGPSIRRSEDFLSPDIMPIRLPEPMPMLPEPMPMRPRMPMPLPIASPLPSSPMPMAPINLPRLELPQTNRIDRQIPMMPRIRGRSR